MPFRQKMKKAMGRGSGSGSGSGSASSPTTSTSPSEEHSREQSPSLHGSGSGTPIDRENLTIDPREIALTQVESNATTIKKKSTLSKLRSPFKKEDPYKDWPEDIYKPHEIPRAKYRRPVDPDHAQTLQSYSLRSAFADMRRRSMLSQYSPMGSRLPSRRGSLSSRLTRSAAPSRTQSIVGIVDENDMGDEDFSEDVGIAFYLPNQEYAADSSATSAPIPMRRRGDTITSNSMVPELVQSSSLDSDDTDSGSSLGTSQAHTADNVSRTGGHIEGLVLNFSKPFDGEELTRALTRKLVEEGY